MRTVNFQLMVPGPVVKRLIFANLLIWVVLQLIIEGQFLPEPWVTMYMGLIPKAVIENFFVWQFATYMFLHSVNPMHVLFNMLSLWFFGSELEMRWGSRIFFLYYLLSGVGAGLIYVFGLAIVGLTQGSVPMAYMQPVLGASGAVFGILLAYGVLFGDRMVYFFGVFPIQARYFVMVIGLIEVVSLLGSGFSGGIANLAHLGGLLSGALLLFGWTRYQQVKWRKTSTTRRNLKLVVNKDSDDQNGPKYWN